MTMPFRTVLSWLIKIIAFGILVALSPFNQFAAPPEKVTITQQKYEISWTKMKTNTKSRETAVQPHPAESMGFFYLCSWAMFLCFLIANTLNASEGLFLMGNGPVETGLAGAGVAHALDSTWITINPATLNGLERRTDVSINFIIPKSELTAKGPITNPDFGTQESQQWSLVPNISMALPWKNGTLGAGIMGVFGLAANYPMSRTVFPKSMNADYDRQSIFGIERLSLAYAHPVNDRWTMGMAIDGNIGFFRADFVNGAGMQTAGMYDWDYALGAGFQVGVVREAEKWRFGFAYTSRQWMQEFDKYDDLFTSSVDLPPIIQTGFSFSLTPQWELLLDYRFIEWSSVAVFGNDVKDGGLNWNDQHVFKIGANYTINQQWQLHSGYSHSTPLFAAEDVFANSYSSAITEDHASLGVSYFPNARHEVHLTYFRAFENAIADNGQGGPVSQLGAGTEVSISYHSITVGYSYKF